MREKREERIEGGKSQVGRQDGLQMRDKGVERVGECFWYVVYSVVFWKIVLDVGVKSLVIIISNLLQRCLEFLIFQVYFSNQNF